MDGEDGWEGWIGRSGSQFFGLFWEFFVESSATLGVPDCAGSPGLAGLSGWTDVHLK